MNKLFRQASLALLSLAPLGATAQTAVDVELSLLIDTSSSIKADEFAAINTAFANAFRTTSVVDAITGGTYGQIAVNLVYFSGLNETVEALPFTLIDSAASASAFADAIEALTRPAFGPTGEGGWTFIGEALKRTTWTFNNAFDGVTNVINVAGDGPESQDINPLSPIPPTTAAQERDAAVANGFTINGLVIDPKDDPIDPDDGLGDDLNLYYQQNVVGGPNSFVINAKDLPPDNYAIKILADLGDTAAIPPVPEASTYGMLGALFLGVLVIARRVRR